MEKNEVMLCLEGVVQCVMPHCSLLPPLVSILKKADDISA
jgi:hypothetical protein